MHVEAHANLAAACNFQDRYDEGEREARAAITLAPQHAGAHVNLAMSLLAQRRWAEGWAEYEWREATDLLGAQKREWAHPRWNGEEVQGRTVLVHAEQGFGDTIQFARLSATIAVTPNPNGAAGNERLHLDINGDYLGWRVALAYNKSDFYDLFGPTKRSRKGSALRLGYDHLLIYDEPRKLTWSNDISWRNGIDTLPEAQNVGSGFTRLVSAESKLAYADLRRSLGAVDDEKGLAAVGLATLNRAGDRSSSQLRGGFDFGLALPWAHSSLWLRSAAGVSQGDASDPVASYYFGGFGNNRVDNGPVKRYREVESMPGFELNAIPARRFAKQTVEWTLPPLIYESVGLPAFHLTWLRPAVFATALRTSGGTSGDGSAGSRNYVSLGGQIDLRFSVQHWNEMFLSIGAATGYRGSQRVGNEWMISLKIM